MWRHQLRQWARRFQRNPGPHGPRLARRGPLRVEPLEDRSTPATLNSVGIGAVTYTAGGGVSNTVTVGTDGTNYTIADTAETITLTAGAVAAGWTGSGTNTVTGPNVNVFTLAINTGDANDAVAVRSVQHPITVDTGTGAGNAVTVGGAAGSGAQEVQGPVQVQSTGGKTALTVDDAANPGSVGAFVDAAAVQGVTFYQIDFTPGDLAALAVLGGAYGNVFYVSGTSAGYTSTVNSGAGDDFVQVLATTGPVAIQGNAGSDTVVVGDAGLTGGVTNNVSVGNSGGQTALTVDDSANAAARSVEVTVPGSPVVGTTTGAVAGFTPSGTAISWVTGELSGIDLNTGTAGDTFNARPDVYTPITLNAGLPTAGVGDTLILNVVGVSNPVITDLSGGLPALPDGKVTSTSHATVTWLSIETFPVPLGLGGTFDFQNTRTVGDPNAQPGFLPVLPSDTPTTGPYAGAAGWLNPGAGAYNRLTQYGAGGEPNSPQLAWPGCSATASGGTPAAAPRTAGSRWPSPRTRTSR